MGIEIERKFLVISDAWRHAAGVRFSQGYLNRDKERTVRVRLAGDKAFLTIKGLTQGASRAEFEYEIPATDGEALLKLCEGPIIEKVRRVLAHEGDTWEIDEFLGENAGLIVAEIELRSEDQTFARPTWLGEEVTHDARYFNSSLASHPFSKWQANSQATAKRNVLFVCSKNQWRSPTAENIWRHHPKLNVRSGGTNTSARHKVSLEDIYWAQVILVMEEQHKARLKSEYSRDLANKPIYVLDIPDDYKYMDPELVGLLESSVESVLGLSE
jgi:adenylate cyclase